MAITQTEGASSSPTSERHARDHGLSSDLRTAVARLYRTLRAERPSHLLSSPQETVLFVLANRGSHTVGELCAIERVTFPTMNHTINSLYGSGYVARAADPEDRRRVVVSATDAGRALVDAERGRRDAWLDQRLQAMDPADRDILRAAVGLMEDLIRQ